MDGGKQVFFPPFNLDISNQCLQRGSVKISLRPKSLCVLAHLVEHPHRLISKEELMSAAWPRAKVVDAALRISIQEIRKALGDGSAAPRFIETVGKQGYRFIAPVSLRLPEAGRESFLPFVGRAAELDTLRHHLETAASGKRQVVFVTGEPGIGKTTLLEAFTSSLSINGILAAHGQCIEQYGAGEAYMPMLDALERLCGGPGGEKAVDLMRRYAPSWLVNMPGLVDAAEHAELERQTAGIPAERRLREIAAFLETMASEQTVVLILEDLHWLDPSTLALISFLARRREAARLMLIGTYRAGEVESQNRPLKGVKEELELHNCCSELSLKLLGRSAVGEYLAARFETPLVSNKVTSAIYKHSEGNPLFMVNMTDYLLTEEAIVQQNGSVELGQQVEKQTPNTIRQLIERQFERLAREDQELLEIASVCGMSFSAAVVAGMLGKPVEEVEKQCDQLVELEHFLQRTGSNRWPDGTVSSQYSFIHVLYENVIYERIGESRKNRLHQAIGERLEAGYKNATEEIAAELATHFERGGDYQRAVRYLLQAAEKALHRSAYPETIDYCRTALSQNQSSKKDRNSDEIEMRLHFLLGVALTSSKGYTATEARESYSQAQAISQHIGNKIVLFQTLTGLWSFHLLRGDVRNALKLAARMLKLARSARNADFMLEALMTTGVALFYRGHIQSSQRHLQSAIPYYDVQRPGISTSVFGYGVGVILRCYNARALWFLGFPDRAEKEIAKAVELAENLKSPSTSALCDGELALNYSYSNEPAKALQLARSSFDVSNEYGFQHWAMLAMSLKGFALCRQGQVKEGLSDLATGIAGWKAIGAGLALPTWLSFQAEGYLMIGKLTEGFDCTKEAIMISTHNQDNYYDAEFHRLKGELFLAKRNNDRRQIQEAEACFHRAIQIARGQRAKSLELRAAMGLCRLWKQHGRKKEAQKMLQTIYGWFTEGFDTPDLKQAKALLDELS
jgi:DNA-binding winged helix-turn-helix (wHTH) protein/predicted ATPase